MPLKREEISAVRDALRRSHRELATFAGTIPPAERTCRSHCTEWTIAQVYSHLGSGAEIGLANLQAGLTGAAPADPSTIWPRWDSLTPDVMVSGLAAADSKYLDALDGPNL
ncbi:MAG TPA: maleylpyruvate isomerase N-terminal domain-containing protein [Nakamurella sp.]